MVYWYDAAIIIVVLEIPKIKNVIYCQSQFHDMSNESPYMKD